jgi:hypothetical protein
MYQFDSVDNHGRRRQLDEYIERALLHADRFVCSSCTSVCLPSSGGDEFIEGEMPHFGPRFSLIDENGNPVRVVVMGQERGVPKRAGDAGLAGARGTKRVTIEQRTETILKNCYPGYRKANSHINGTVWGLVAALTRNNDWQREDVPVDGNPVHVLRTFVMTNSTLCTAIRPNGRAKASQKMRSECVRHSRSMFGLLEPTHLILQGEAARGTAESALGLPQNSLRIRELKIVRIGETECRVYPLEHPTSQGATNWSGPRREYFLRAVAPFLRSR